MAASRAGVPSPGAGASLGGIEAAAWRSDFLADLRRRYARPVARPSPFADVTDGPGPDAVVVELGHPTRAALGCFGFTTVFLAAIALPALSYAVFGTPGPVSASGTLRAVAAVVGAVFLVIVAGLAVVAVRAVRTRQGLAFDAGGAWWRLDGDLLRLPWDELAVARLVAPVVVRGMRTSAPRTPTVELCPVDDSVIRRAAASRPRLADRVTSGEPPAPGLPALRFAFRLPPGADEGAVVAALERFAPRQWAAGQEPARPEKRENPKKPPARS